MLKNLIIFFCLGLFLWFLPEMVMFTRKISDYVYQEAANNVTRRVEVKVVEPFFNMPDKFALLNRGIADVRVELVNAEGRASGVATDKNGSALFDGLGQGMYQVRLGSVREYSNADLRRYESYGDSLIMDNEVIPAKPQELSIQQDSFYVVIIPNRAATP